MVFDTSGTGAPHGGQRVLVNGSTKIPRTAAILLHGRGASAADISSLAVALDGYETLFIATDAAQGSWYPFSFLAPIANNQPGIDSAHAVIETLISQLGAQLRARAIPPERIALIGFSQGACLASDHAFRFPRRYGAIIAFTGGLIGPSDHQFVAAGDLAATPVFLGANEPDPHVPWHRVERTAEVLSGMGAIVDIRRYPNRPHTIVAEEIDVAREMLRSMAVASRGR